MLIDSTLDTGHMGAKERRRYAIVVLYLNANFARSRLAQSKPNIPGLFLGTESEKMLQRSIFRTEIF